MGALKKMLITLMESGLTQAEAEQEINLLLQERVTLPVRPHRVSRGEVEQFAEYDPAGEPISRQPLEA